MANLISGKIFIQLINLLIHRIMCLRIEYFYSLIGGTTKNSNTQKNGQFTQKTSPSIH